MELNRCPDRKSSDRLVKIDPEVKRTIILFLFGFRFITVESEYMLFLDRFPLAKRNKIIECKSPHHHRYQRFCLDLKTICSHIDIDPAGIVKTCLVIDKFIER